MTATAPTERPFETAEEVVRLVERFAEATLPHAEWTHRAHLTVALWYASQYPPAEALERMRAGILRLNAAHGVVTTPTRGYHETITRFYMHVVSRHVARERSAGDWAERANRFVARYGSRELPLAHYSEARLKSAEARYWVGRAGHQAARLRTERTERTERETRGRIGILLSLSVLSVSVLSVISPADVSAASSASGARSRRGSARRSARSIRPGSPGPP